MNLRRQAAQALGDAIHGFARLQERPVVISAPPSEVTDYPRVAIWLEHFTRNYSQSEDLEVDAS